MNFIFKKRIKRGLAFGRSLTRYLRPKNTAGRRILLYHSIGGAAADHRLAVRVSPVNFEEQLRFLVSEGYKTLTLTELIEKGLDGKEEKIIAITFDDGYKDNMDNAAALLKRLGLTATFFITTSYIDGTDKKVWEGGRPREYMTWKDIADLNGMGFEIGSHMINHTDLTGLSDMDLAREFAGSRDMISGHIGRDVKVFSYPYGKIDSRVISVAKRSGYAGGCSSFTGLNYGHTDRYILRRTEIDGYDIINDFRMKLEGWYD